MKKEGKTGPIVQLFAGFNDDKPAVIGLSENINRFMCEYKPSWLKQQELSMIESSMFEKNLAFSYTLR